MSFAIAMALGPVLASHYGISLIFVITAILALLAILIPLQKYRHLQKSNISITVKQVQKIF
jgi:uncharacterized membrane protein